MNINIEKFRASSGEILNRAMDNKWLFVHCNNGKPVVTTRKFNDEVKWLLYAHGVTSIEIFDNT